MSIRGLERALSPFYCRSHNSIDGAQTTLGGAVAGNTQLDGKPAGIIEVTGNTASSPNGMIEVAGPSARVIIANPNGITAGGAGFINANRMSLVAGKALMDYRGQLTRLQTERGQIRVEGSGLDASGTSEVDLVARTLQINAQVQGRKLNAVALKGEVDAIDPTRLIKRLGADGQADIAIDVAQLGSMHADSIRMVGRSAGVGVNLQGKVRTLTGSLVVTTDGKVQIASTGSMDAKQGLSIAENLNNKGALSSGGSLSLVGDLDTNGPIRVGGTMAGNGNLNPATIMIGGATNTNAQNGIGAVVTLPALLHPSYAVTPVVWTRPVVSYPLFHRGVYPSVAATTLPVVKKSVRALPQPRYW